jgi:uncharacterized protein (DUF1810 family)
MASMRKCAPTIFSRAGMPGSSTSSADPFHLSRFVQAQEGIYDRALAEIRGGRKRSHWMWFVFPQYAGLGFSAMSQEYAIKSIEEARDYLNHPVLGPRLIECTQGVLGVEGHTASQIFGSPDDMKLRSSATLFAHVTGAGNIYEQVLQKYFDSQPDPKTMQLLAVSGGW